MCLWSTDLWEKGVPALIGAPKILLPPCDLADDDGNGIIKNKINMLK